MTERDLFIAALELDPAARAALFDRECPNDQALRQRVEKLLAAHAEAGSAFGPQDRTIDHESATAISPMTDVAGTVVAGRYKLLEVIGEGGMGTVWVAEQTQPVQRKVALKLIKAGMDSKSVLARFETERQALAVMDHPNIAKVLDGGLTETGRPFFVMEYVKGVPITEYCEAARLSIPQRLQLFVQVCQAVQHAHQKGIIHRDLKPSNILVAPYDDRPVPKVIDFGLAKAIHQSPTERTLHTAHEAVLGTPLYMSPEQAQLNNLDIDTRSDLYSLGVLLYELLTGTTPLEKQRFKEAAWDEIRRVIREEDPPRPSMRLSSSQMLPSLAAGRQTEPARLTKLIRGDLDWIVMKALEKDRTRRYETANGFGLDVQRYLAGEPVLAAPPSARYRLRKFARKHRAALTTAAAMIALLLAGVAFSTWQAVRATRAEAAALAAELVALQAQQAETLRAEGERLAKLDADAKRTEAERQKSIAEQQTSRAVAGEKLASERFVQVAAEKKKAEEEKQIAQAVRDFLQKKLLGQADSWTQANTLLRSGGRATEAKENPSIRELLDRAAQELAPEKIDANFPNQPLVQAEILQTVGRTYHGVGDYEPAISFLERSTALYRQHLGPDHPETLTSMSILADTYRTAGKLDLAFPLLKKTLKLQKANLGPDHSATLTSMNRLACAYEAAGQAMLAASLVEEEFKLRKAKLGPNHPTVLISMNDLAQAYQDAGKLDLALPLFEETVKLQKANLGPDHPETLSSMNNLANTYQAAGKLDLALPLYERTLNLMKAKLGSDHPNTLTSMNNLASAYQAAGKLDLAVPLFEQALKITKAKIGSDHPLTLTMMSNLGLAYQAAGKLDLALPLCQQTLKLTKAKLGPDHPRTLISMNILAAAYQAAGKLDLALPLHEQTLKLMKAKLGPDHPHTLLCMGKLAQTYLDSGKLDLALPMYEETLKRQKAKLGPEHPDTLASMNDLAWAYRLAGKPDLELLLLEEVYTPSKKYLKFRRVGPALLEDYLRAGKTEQAAALAKDLLADARAKLPKESPHLADQLAAVASFLLQTKAFTEAESLLRECLSIREKAQPDEWTTFNSKSMLGGALSGQKRYVEAEPLLLAGYEGIKQREAKIPPTAVYRLTAALEQLVHVYDVQGKKDSAAKWRKELEAWKQGLPRPKPDNLRPQTSRGTRDK